MESLIAGFFQFFLRYCQIFPFRTDTGHLAMSALSFDIFLKLSHLLKS